MSRPLNLDGVQNSQLFTTSLASDVQSSNDVLTVGIMPAVSKKQIAQMVQVKYAAEVGQIVTVTTGTSLVPAGSTKYIIAIGDTNRTRNGVQEQLKFYSYTTPADITTLGAIAALQREAINGELISQINADTDYNFVTATTLGTGTGFTVTDATGYYPVNAQGMTVRQGASTVKACCDTNATGFVGTEAAITTAANYGFGIGAQLANYRPIIDQMWGNLISGYLGGVAPKTAAGAYATSGQQYDGFAIVGLSPSPTSTGHSQTAYVPLCYIAYVDNGSGTSTTNLAGYKAFARQWRKNASAMFANDQSVVIEYFDKPIVFQDPLGAAPTGTADTLGWQLSPYGALNRTNIGTQTIVAPVLDATGLLIDQDDAATEGSHTSANQQTLGDQQFVVGKQEFSLVTTVVAADWTDTAFMTGFRLKEAYQAVILNYNDYACIGTGSSAAGTTWINGDKIVTQGTLNNAATVQTISAVAPTDAVSIEFMIKVALDGTVTAFANGVSYPIYSAGTTTMVFDAGDVLIPFYQFVNINDAGAAGCSISEFVAVPTKEGFIAIG